jgi:hypothetical protein
LVILTLRSAYGDEPVVDGKTSLANFSSRTFGIEIRKNEERFDEESRKRE